ncbi:Clu domain-containing protein [Entamoeba marina]
MEHPVYDAYMYMSYPNQRKYSQSWKNESGSFSSDNHSNESTSDRYQYFNEEISEDAKVDNVTPKSPSNSPTNINGIKDKDKEFVRKTTIPKQKMKLHISSIPQLSTYQYTPRRREIPTSLFEKRLSTNGLRPTITYNPGLKSSKFSPTRSPENESVLEKASLHWNERYQEILCREESHEKFEELVTHYNDFLKTAEIYGKIIISEFYLSPSEKTIKPHIIGQTPESNQFLVRGILFKSAHDSFTSFSSSLSHSNENIPLNHSTTSTFFSNFDSDNSPTCENYQFQNCVDHDILSHAANQQLKALQGFHNAQVDGISLPLTVVIDYCGIRLFAISVLPINIESLRYGSRGFGTIHTDDTTLNELMKSVATTLNIKGHVIRGNLLYAPADIEVYEGRDGRYYVLESTRLFPREAPSKFIKKEQSDGIFGLCADETKLDYVEKCEDCSLRCFRPEFVKQYKKALSPDAFSVFDHEDESMIENRKRCY